MQDLFHFYEGTMSSEMAPSKQALDLAEKLPGRFLDMNSEHSSLEGGKRSAKRHRNANLFKNF